MLLRRINIIRRMMSGNFDHRTVDSDMDGIKLDNNHHTTEARVQQPDIQSGNNVAKLQNCKEGLATSADNQSDTLNTFSHTEVNMELLASGDGVPSVKHVASINDERKEIEPSISSSSVTSSSTSICRLKMSSDTKKHSGWFQCSDCGQKLRGKAKLKSHMKLFHKGSSKTGKVVKRNTSGFKCGVRVKGKKNLSQHGFFAYKGQTRIKSIVKSIENSSSIPLHSAVVADSTSQCRRFVEKSNTEVKHLRLGPWFTCRNCDHIFKGRSQLQQHVQLKHQDLNDAQDIQPSMPETTHTAKSEQCQGNMDRKLLHEAVTDLAPECPVENQDVESVVSSNQIWHQCDPCGVKVKGRKKLQKHTGKCEKQTTTSAVITLQTNLSAYETSATKNRCWYKCRHCCRQIRGRKRFMHHIHLCVNKQDGTALWQRMSHWKQCSWYRCSGCQRTFKGKNRIQLHALECHTEDPSSRPSVETGRQCFEKKSSHACSLCRKHFQRKLFLDKHMKKCQGQQGKINLSEQGSIDDVQNSELVQEQGRICEAGDDSAPKGQTVEENDESRAQSDHQPCSETKVEGDAISQLTLVFLQDGSWYKCQICGQNLRGKEQIKKHSHDQNNKETETEELESLNTSCLVSEFLNVGSWHRCKICGENLRGKEHLKNHTHAHEIKKPEEQEPNTVSGWESNFLRVGTWHRCKICGENLRGKEQVKNHSHDLKVVNPDDEKADCPNPCPPCLDFVQVGTWYSCKVCGQKLQGRKQMQAHTHSQTGVDREVHGNSLGSAIQNALRSVEDGFIQVGSWYRCKSCLVRFRGRRNAEGHHRFKCCMGEGGYCHEDLLPEHQPEHAPRHGQDQALCHDVQPTSDDIEPDVHQAPSDTIAHDIHQAPSDDIVHDTQHVTSDDMVDDKHLPTSHKFQHDLHQPKGDVQGHGTNEQYGCIDQAVSSMTSKQVTVRDYIIKKGKCWECHVCSKMIQSWIGAFKHVKSHFTGTRLYCSICNKLFSSSGNRRKHERTHNTGYGSSALKKNSLKRSPHSHPQQRKAMNPTSVTRMNRKQFSTPTTAADCSQKTNIQRPNIAVEREYMVEKELTLRKPTSPETVSAGASVADTFVGDASVTSASVEGDFVDNASNVYAVSDDHIEAPTLPCYGTSEENRSQWHKDQAFMGSGGRDQSLPFVYVDTESMCSANDSGTDVDQTCLCNAVLSSDDKEVTSELCDSSENERQSVQDVQHDEYALFSEYEDNNPQDSLCIAELYEKQQHQVMSDGAKAPMEAEYKKLYQTFISLSSKVAQGKQEQDNHQENMENESTSYRDLNVALSDINCLSRPLLEWSETDSHEYEGLSESGSRKVAVVKDCSLDADSVMSDVCRHPDLAWSNDKFVPQTDNFSMEYDQQRGKEEPLNFFSRKITQDNYERSLKSQISSDMLPERMDVMDSARAGRKNLPNSKHGKNRIVSSMKCKMKTACNPKQNYDMCNFQLMPYGNIERRNQNAANKSAGGVDDKQISDDCRSHEDQAISSCGQMDFVNTSSDVKRKKPTLYKTRKELYMPEKVRFERGQEEKRQLKDCLDDGDSMFKTGRGMSVKAPSNQRCDRSADRDEKSRQGRYVCSICYKTFASENVAAYHLKQHARHRKNRAKNSSKKTVINAGFKKHCRVCQRLFMNQGDLELHECRHLMEDTVGTFKCVMCEVCGERYQTQQLLDQHQVGHQVWLKCSHCNLYFAKVTELHQHCLVARHFVCECGDAFTSYAKLDIHRDACVCSN